MDCRMYNGMQNILPVTAKAVGLVITESFYYLTIACCFFSASSTAFLFTPQSPQPHTSAMDAMHLKFFHLSSPCTLILAEQHGASRRGFGSEILNKQKLVLPERQAEGSKMGWRLLPCHINESVTEGKCIQLIPLVLLFL